MGLLALRCQEERCGVRLAMCNSFLDSTVSAALSVDRLVYARITLGLNGVETCGYFIPVENVPYCGHVVSFHVLVLQVERMLPHIE